MKFEKLNDMLPYVQGGKQKILSYQPYNAITLRFPGRHALDTNPIGGDFVVCVDDEVMDWTAHQFTHTDLFMDLSVKAAELPGKANILMEHYLEIVFNGFDPEKAVVEHLEGLPGIHPQTFLYAVQCLAVAEHRRYAKFEPQFGGRYLPFRFGAGIVEGLWTAGQAAEKQRRGRPGVEWLEKDYGLPILTKELIGT